MTTVRKPLRLAANVVVNESDITKSAVSPCTRYTSSTHTDKRPLLESPPSMRTLKKQRALPIRQSNGDIRDSSVQAQQHDSINMDYPSDDDLIILLSSSDSAHESDISCPANDVMIILSSSDSESVSEPSDSDSDSMPVSHAHSHTDSHSDAEIVIRLDSSDDEFAIIISDSESIRSNSSGNVSSDDEDSVYQKKPMGPRTAIFFEEVYGKYYEEDPEMTCGSHKYDFTRSPGSELQYPDNERDLMDYDEHNVQVGDFVELNWDKDGKWMARVTAVSAKGIRFVNLYLANQTYIGAVGDVLMEELLFQTSECNCYHGWLHFDSIIRIISVSYTNQLTDGYDYFAPSYYCVDDFVFSNIPPEFLTSKGTPFDLCHCPNTDNELEWTVKNTNVNQMEAHAITLAKKRTFQPGKFYSLQNVPFDFEFRGTVLDDVVEIVEFDSEADEPILVVRVFERVENTINELRWTDVLTSLVGWKEIARVSKAECFVEYWDGVSQSFAVQYNGAGRRFFIRDEEQADRYPVNLPKREMRILDAFSGTGNYSKGIADSQIGTPSCAVDSWSYAIRSYNAIHNKQIAEKQCINEFLQDAAWEARNHPEQIKESRYDLRVVVQLLLRLRILSSVYLNWIS
ncbi:hypothetical protein BCR33DRAFT_715087 [Rhizoclosmatium globosum]|uniref:Uncharacterized protein n=1 Tax=Rhizoclosmatium globosum TaxID=329046 RepID=A0A1Y2CK44_9FUNG|nr:hypothetical protein BCR33DRAFT_715087 [Rhizoclosmatium globosum]|eukprot:ORY47356.1 hypothetical protein BCR33DRAFT_715087 [Rhizoclosmatium globosum]